MVKTVFVNGTFDVLHFGHLSLLTYAKSWGGILVVGIDSDDRVRSKKGSQRPINSEFERKQFLLSLKAVDKVEIFSSDEELRALVKKHSPDLMIVGDDYIDKEVIGSEFAKQLYFYKKIDGYSSTQKIKDIANRG